MIHPETHLVTKENGPRPAGRPDECFYCNAALGAEHRAECVLRRRTIVVETVVRYVVEEPEHWTAEDLHFHRNLSSSCASNVLREIADAHDAMPDYVCPCGRVRTTFVREATEADERERIVL